MNIRSITKLLAAPLALLVLTAGVYKGDHLTITFPDGWSEPMVGEENLVTTNQGENGVNCNVQNKEIPALADMTLAEINAELGHVYTLAEWADFVGKAPEDVIVMSSDIRPLEDAIFHIATMKLKANDTINVIARYGFYVLPGRVVIAGCYAEESIYPIYTTLFEKTVSSLRPW